MSIAILLAQCKPPVQLVVYIGPLSGPITASAKRRDVVARLCILRNVMTGSAEPDGAMHVFSHLSIQNLFPVFRNENNTFLIVT